MNRTRPSLTEKTAAIAWARAHNTHDIELLAPLVHDDLRIVDQRNWDQRVGGRHYLGMLEDYFECVPRDRSQTWMELATVPPAPFEGGLPGPASSNTTEAYRSAPCSSASTGARSAASRNGSCRPPTECQLAGVYPGLDIGPTEEVN